MAGFFKVADIQARKRALIGESEIYRETLRLECQNIRLYVLATRKKIGMVRSVAPVLMIGLPLLGSFLIRRRQAPRPRSRLGLLKSAFAIWRTYRTLGPVVHAAMVQWIARRSSVGRQNPQTADPSPHPSKRV